MDPHLNQPLMLARYKSGVIDEIGTLIERKRCLQVIIQDDLIKAVPGKKQTDLFLGLPKCQNHVKLGAD